MKDVTTADWPVVQPHARKANPWIGGLSLAPITCTLGVSMFL